MADLTQTTGFVPVEQYKALECKYDLLSDELAELKRLIFGSKSERFVGDHAIQPGLFELPLAEEPMPQTEHISYDRTKPSKQKAKPVRAEIPADLLREEIVIEPDPIPEGSKRIGEQITETLEIKPMVVYVKRIVRPKYALPGGEGVLIADLPSQPIPRGNAGASLLAHLQVSKWVDHLPYYRQIAIFKRHGIKISSSTINDWFNSTCELLRPLYDCLVNTILKQPYLQADETPIKVLDSNKKKATHTGYHWVYHAPWIEMVAFDYQPTRSAAGPANFLKHYKGVLQTDGYAGYNKIAFSKSGKPITLLGCMAHARRYFEKALDNDKARAEWMLKKMQWLYEIEAQLREHQIPTYHKHDLRQREALPVLHEMKQWMQEQIQQVPPKSKIAKAMAYSLNLWDRLIRYTENGDYLIDNNLIENTIRPVALGRKNYLFAGSHNAAQNAAMMYSFFGTCKLQKIEPYHWLTTTLERIPNHKINRLAELLPGYGT